MRILAALTILTMSIVLADGQARAQTYGPGFYGPWAYESVPNSYCLQGRDMGLSRQLPILQLRPMHGHRERYCSPIAGSIPTTRSPASGAATIDPDTEPVSSSTGSVVAARVCT